jgi:AraC-like DNA-binding protein
MTDLIRFNLASLLLLLTVFQGGVFSVFLLTSRRHSGISARLLGAFTLNFTLHFANILVSEFGPLTGGARLNPVFGLVYGPLLLLFVRSLVRRGFRMRAWGRHLLIPVVVALLVVTDISIPSPVASAVVLAHLSGYLVAARLELEAFRKDLRDSFSEIDEINLDWLSRLLDLMFFLVGIAVVHFIAQSMGSDVFQRALTILIFASALYLVNALVLKGMRHPPIDIWLRDVAGRSESSIAEESLDEAGSSTNPGPGDGPGTSSNDRYRGSGLSPEDSRSHFEELEELMKRDEPFLDERLNIHQLAETIGISSKHLSQVINQNSDQNFYDFINRYRIEKAKGLLASDRQDLRVSEVMFEVGYSAKSTFNALFKRYTGMTPSEYRSRKGPKG